MLAGTPYGFAFKCGYQGVTWYAVIGDGNRYEVAARHSLHGHERRHWNGTEASWLSIVVPTLHGLVRDSRPDREIPGAVVDAFNAWRAAEQRSALASLLADPARYGPVEPGDRARQAPAPCRGLRLGRGKPHVGAWDVTHPWPEDGGNPAFHLRCGHHDFDGRGSWTFELADGSANGWDLQTREAAEAAAVSASLVHAHADAGAPLARHRAAPALPCEATAMLAIPGLGDAR